MTPQYSEAFKSKLVRKLTGPSAPSQGRLSAELGIPQPTLSRWVREAATLGAMSNPKKPKSPSQWTTLEKLRLVVEASALKDEELGEFLRRAGVHEAQLKQWREAVETGLAASTKTKSPAPEARQVKALSKELRRKDKALAEVTALLVLKKNPLGARSHLWGEKLRVLQPPRPGRSGRMLFGDDRDPVKKHGPGAVADLALVTPSGDPV